MAQEFCTVPYEQSTNAVRDTQDPSHDPGYMYMTPSHTHLVLQQSLWADDLIKDVFPYVSIDSRQRVIQQVDGTITVDGPGQAHPLLLTS